MNKIVDDASARKEIIRLAKTAKLDIKGGKMRRTSSRFCLGVEHGDYNGTELFGVGTDRFIWLAYKPNALGKIRLFSGNFESDGVIEFKSGQTPAPKSAAIADTWARYAYGVDYVLRKAGYKLTRGFDAVLIGNIPGGGMSRSASLCINLMLTTLEVNGISIKDGMKIVDMSQAVENDYVGSPCGKLDQIMIYFAKAGMGTHYSPSKRTIKYVSLGKGASDFRIVSLDTGTVRPGLEKSSYKVRRAECEKMAELAGAEFGIKCLADVKTDKQYKSIIDRFQRRQPDLCDRLTYIFKAQKRFYEMMEAWKAGKIEKVGSIFRADGVGLRDEYKISGPELETMCDIVRTVPGVYGERMLGGGDKGAAGAIVAANSVKAVREAVNSAYPRSRPAFADKYAVHVCKVVDGVKVLPGC